MGKILTSRWLIYKFTKPNLDQVDYLLMYKSVNFIISLKNMPERLRNTKDFFKNALSSASFEFAFNPFKQQANFTTKKYENEIVHLVYGARIWTHNLLIVSLLPKPLDQGYGPTREDCYSAINNLVSSQSYKTFWRKSRKSRFPFKLKQKE